MAVGKGGGVLRHSGGRAADGVHVHVDSGVGIVSPYRRCTAMASSVICSKKSTFQYQCSPLGSKSASKAVCSTEYGIGASPTNSGSPKSRTGASASSAWSGPD